jgi:hypothetical protein
MALIRQAHRAITMSFRSAGSFDRQLRSRYWLDVGDHLGRHRPVVERRSDDTSGAFHGPSEITYQSRRQAVRGTRLELIGHNRNPKPP